MIQLRPHQVTILDTLSKNVKGQVIVPTGGGKTMCMIKDAQRQFNSCEWDIINRDCDRKTIVIVAPRILLAQQLCEDFISSINVHPMLQYKVLHVHSGDTHHFSSTNPETICNWSQRMYRFNKLIFTTYHSLHRIQESGIEVDSLYFDEAHNSVQRNFQPATKFYSTRDNIRCFFFTATPKHCLSNEKIGMENEEVYGKVLCDIPAPKLVKQGHILPPKVVVKRIKREEDSRLKCEHDCENLLSTIDEQSMDKILICARSTAQIVSLTSQTRFCLELHSRGYSWMYITSKTGAIVDGKKINREEFFTILNKWGKDSTKKFVVLHHSILSEGINVSGLEAALFLRNMDYITISQTIGRVIRKGDVNKKFGLVVIPAWDRVGITTSRKVEAVVDTIFNKGQAAVSVVRS